MSRRVGKLRSRPWAHRGQEGTRQNCLAAIDLWLTLAPSTGDLVTVVDLITRLLARHQRSTRKGVTP